MWRWWWWGWSDDKIEPNPSEERPLPTILGALHPLLVNLHPPIPSPNAAGGKLTPGPFEPQNKQLQQYCSPQTKGASKTEALCPPAAGQGKSKRVRGRRVVIREEHTEFEQQQQQDTEAQQLRWNQEVGLDLLSGGRKICLARAKMWWNVMDVEEEKRKEENEKQLWVMRERERE